MSKIFQSTEKSFKFLTVASFFIFVWTLAQSYSYEWWLLSIFVYFLTGCLGITVMYHRYLTHRSYRTYKIFEYLFSFFGAVGGTGSTIGWVAVHREHHKHADKQNDPHSPVTNSVWGIFTNNYNFEFNKWMVRDLLTSKFHLLLHGYYNLILFIWSVFWLLFGIEFFVFVVVIPMFYQLFFSAASVYLAHTYGYRTYDTDDNSRNNWLNSIIAWGEGWHNNHHAKPGRWNFQHKWWEIDVGGLVVRLIKTN